MIYILLSFIKWSLECLISCIFFFSSPVWSTAISFKSTYKVLALPSHHGNMKYWSFAPLIRAESLITKCIVTSRFVHLPEFDLTEPPLPFLFMLSCHRFHLLLFCARVFISNEIFINLKDEWMLVQPHCQHHLFEGWMWSQKWVLWCFERILVPLGILK